MTARNDGMAVFENYQGILSEYEVTENSRPRVCPMCKASRKLHRHGTRNRYAGHCQIKVGRFYCPGCHKTVTVLPRQLLSRFINPLRDLLVMLRTKINWPIGRLQPTAFTVLFEPAERSRITAYLAFTWKRIIKLDSARNKRKNCNGNHCSPWCNWDRRCHPTRYLLRPIQSPFTGKKSLPCQIEKMKY